MPAPRTSYLVLRTYLCWLAFLLVSVAGLRAESSSRPNIIVILVDDMGWSDLGCYGSEIPTPNIDRLALGGVRFTQFYNTARCCPTRATLLTGLYSHQTGVGHMVADQGAEFPGYRGQLNDHCVTIAEVLGSGGYFTAMTGKWHVGQSHGVTPWGRGFQRNLTAAAGGFYYPTGKSPQLFLNGEAIPGDDPRLPKSWYTTDMWTEFGIKFIDEAQRHQQPFFLYLAHNAPHFPLQAPRDDIARFRGKYRQNWDSFRAARHARQIEMGLVDKSWPPAHKPRGVREWDKLTDEEKDRFDHIMAIYAATVSRIDHSIGTLVTALKERNILDNTLVLLMSDNGGNAESGPQGRLEGDSPGTADSTVFVGESWAWVNNTPFREYKHFVHEGGISSPLIVHWPSGIASKGELRHQPGHLIDIMATCVDVSGIKYPTTFREKAIHPLEGRSLVPALANEPIERDALYWEHEGNAAVRVGDWKLVRKGRNGAWELYDLKSDRTEQTNLADAMPDKVKHLGEKWDAWARRANVLPYPTAKNNKNKQS